MCDTDDDFFLFFRQTEEDIVRPDDRVINLCNAPADSPSVYLDNGTLDELALKAIGKMLPFLENVNVVSFANTELADEDISILGEALTKSSIHILKLNNNMLTDAGAKKLVELVSSNKSLEEIDVSGNKIGNEGAASLASLFAAKQIKSINIENNKVADAGIGTWCAALKDVSTPILQFSANNIGDGACAAIAALIKDNVSILEVHLDQNSISDAGCATLCKALANNGTVLKVDLSNNAISSTGLKQVHEMLKTNKVLRFIDISNNEIFESSNSSIALAKLEYSRFQKYQEGLTPRK